MHAWIRHHAADEGKAAYTTLPEIGTPDEDLTTLIDTAGLLATATRGDRPAQVADARRSRGCPTRCSCAWLGREHLVRVNPPWTGGPLETELMGL